MSSADLAAVVFYVCFAICLIFWVRRRRSKLIHIADYQVGLRFRGNGACKLLLPGNYRHNVARDPITVVDLRPVQFIVERLMFQDALIVSAVISMSGEIVIKDPMSAVKHFKSLTEDSITTVREGLRQVVSKLIVDSNPEARTSIAPAITASLNHELESRGIVLQNLEITELWAESFYFAIPAEVN